jgi:ssDNA-binding Zn-finger/Zn-ribbon topoisomerase 1
MMTKTEVMTRACQTLRCGDCGGPMHAVSGRYGEFFACVQYPLCKGTVGAYPDGRPTSKRGRPRSRESKVALR